MTSTDGTTAIQVSPIPTENEMNGFRHMLDRALNAIVQASELAKVVDDLKLKVEQFNLDMDSQRRRNQELDEMLMHVRSQRDSAEQRLSEADRKLNDTQAELGHVQTLVKDQADEIDRLKSALVNARNEAIDNYNHWQREAERAEAAETKLANFQSLAMDAFGLHKPEPVQSTSPEPSGAPLTVTQIEELKPENAHAEQAQAAERKRVYEDEPSFDWSKPVTWDYARNARYQEA